MVRGGGGMRGGHRGAFTARTHWRREPAEPRIEALDVVALDTDKEVGTITAWIEGKGFGFSGNYFVHANHLMAREDFPRLKKGARIRFQPGRQVDNPSKLAAIDVEILDEQVDVLPQERGRGGRPGLPELVALDADKEVGTIDSWTIGKDFGFSGKYFVHASHLMAREDFPRLKKGARIRFQPGRHVDDPSKLRALEIEILDEEPRMMKDSVEALISIGTWEGIASPEQLRAKLLEQQKCLQRVLELRQVDLQEYAVRVLRILARALGDPAAKGSEEAPRLVPLLVDSALFQPTYSTGPGGSVLYSNPSEALQILSFCLEFCGHRESLRRTARQVCESVIRKGPLSLHSEANELLNRLRVAEDKDVAEDRSRRAQWQEEDPDDPAQEIEVNARATLPLHPTEEELNARTGKKEDWLKIVPRNIVGAPLRSFEVHLDTHYRLLREDFMATVCEGIQQLRQPGSSGKKRRVVWKIQIQCLSLMVTPMDGVHFQFGCQIDNPRFRSSVEKKLMFGSLVIVSSIMNFAPGTLHFATVAGSCQKTEKQKDSLLQFSLRFHDDFMDHFQPRRVLFAAVFSFYYLPYERILECLKKLNVESIPIDIQEALQTGRTVVPPYIQRYPFLNLQGVLQFKPEADAFAENFNVLEGNWGDVAERKLAENDATDHSAEHALDRTQAEALREMFRNNVSITQGTPGTGKTFIGAKMVQALIRNRRELQVGPILVLCFSNHALDSFLLQLLDFMRPDSVLRIGRQSSNEKIKEMEIHRKPLPRIPFPRSASIHKNVEELLASVELHNNILKGLARVDAQSLTNSMYNDMIKYVEDEHLQTFLKDVGDFFDLQKSEQQKASCSQRDLQRKIESIYATIQRDTEGIKVRSPSDLDYLRSQLIFPAEKAEQAASRYYEKIMTLMQQEFGNLGWKSQPYVELLSRDIRDCDDCIAWSERELLHSQSSRKRPREHESILREQKYHERWKSHLEAQRRDIVGAASKLTEARAFLSQQRGKIASIEARRPDILKHFATVAELQKRAKELKQEERQLEKFLQESPLTCWVTKPSLSDPLPARAAGVAAPSPAAAPPRLNPTETANEAHPLPDVVPLDEIDELELEQLIQEERELPDDADEPDEDHFVDLSEVAPTDLTAVHRLLSRPNFANEATIDERRCVAEAVLHEARKNCTQRIRRLFEQMEELREEYLEYNSLRKATLMKEYQVVGATTIGAAVNLRAFQLLKAKVVVVEECCEVLEAHILATLTSNVQHLILVGDHRQLYPKVQEHFLEKRKKLGVSLMERVVKISPEKRHITLNVQQRMHPELSFFTKEYYWEKEGVRIIDHPLTRTRPPVTSVEDRRRVMFIDVPDGEEEENEGIQSPFNHAEAVLAVLICMFICQAEGVSPSHITLMVPYTGQLFEAYKEARRLSLPYSSKTAEGVRIATIDNYQGEENEFVVISTTRTKKPGFLTLDNRACVALTRARRAMYVVGNQRIIAEASTENKIWRDFLENCRSNKLIFTQFCGRCQVHGAALCFSNEAEYNRVIGPNGGCRRRCEQVLVACGHMCRQFCHSAVHNADDCREPCGRRGLQCKVEDDCPPRQCEHPCEKRCGEVCGRCKAKIKVRRDCAHTAIVECWQHPNDMPECKVLLTSEHPACGHRIEAPCHLWVSHRDEVLQRCREACQMRLSCGHLCMKKCHAGTDPDGHADCSRQTTGTLPCGHEATFPCRQLAHLEGVFCRAVCGAQRNCGHTCPRICGKCVAEGAHPPCEEPVPVTLPRCQHRAEVKCHEQDDLAKVSCAVPCGQTLWCGHPCGGTCGSCYSSTGFFTSHGRCRHPCPRRLVCGHRCNSICSKECPPCSAPCENRCPHADCGKLGSKRGQHKCGNCVDCREDCNNQCRHSKCSRSCSDSCDREPCGFRCEKLLQCGHQCVGLCGERCPRFCPQCHVPAAEESSEAWLSRMLPQPAIDGNDSDPQRLFQCLSLLAAEVARRSSVNRHVQWMGTVPPPASVFLSAQPPDDADESFEEWELCLVQLQCEHMHFAGELDRAVEAQAGPEEAIQPIRCPAAGCGRPIAVHDYYRKEPLIRRRLNEIAAIRTKIAAAKENLVEHAKAIHGQLWADVEALLPLAEALLTELKNEVALEEPEAPRPPKRRRREPEPQGDDANHDELENSEPKLREDSIDPEFNILEIQFRQKQFQYESFRRKIDELERQRKEKKKQAVDAGSLRPFPRYFASCLLELCDNLEGQMRKGVLTATAIEVLQWQCNLSSFLRDALAVLEHLQEENLVVPPEVGALLDRGEIIQCLGGCAAAPEIPLLREFCFRLDSTKDFLRTVLVRNRQGAELARGDVARLLRLEAALRSRLCEGASAAPFHAADATFLNALELKFTRRAFLQGIAHATGLSAGHWYKCPNGHLYAIANCGGANQRATCPECGAAIGGMNHAVEPNNRSAAADFDPNAQSASPQPQLM